MNPLVICPQRRHNYHKGAKGACISGPGSQYKAEFQRQAQACIASGSELKGVGGRTQSSIVACGSFVFSLNNLVETHMGIRLKPLYAGVHKIDALWLFGFKEEDFVGLPKNL
jgi:hypothetical protein